MHGMPLAFVIKELSPYMDKIPEFSWVTQRYSLWLSYVYPVYFSFLLGDRPRTMNFMFLTHCLLFLPLFNRISAKNLAYIALRDVDDAER
jgi:hypothetical protein